MTIPYPWKTGQEGVDIAAHKTRHQDGGDDEIDLTGLLGLLADDQHVLDSEVTAVAVAHSLATAVNDFLVASGGGTFGKKTLAETLTILGKAIASGLASLDASSKVVQEPASKGIASGIASLNASTRVVEQPASISNFLEDTPTEDLPTKAPTSEWAFDHNAGAPSSTVHSPIHNSLARVYLGTAINDIPSPIPIRIEFDTKAWDLGNNFTMADWYGVAGAYRQSDADSDATHIQDDDAAFPTTMLGAKVVWASDAAGTLNTGVGYVLAGSDSDTLVITKQSGTDFAASYYYYIKKCHYIAPVTGYYGFGATVGYTDVVADRYYIAYVLKNGGTGAGGEYGNNIQHSSFAFIVRNSVAGVVNLAAGDILALYAYSGDTSLTTNIEAGYARTAISIWLISL